MSIPWQRRQHVSPCTRGRGREYAGAAWGALCIASGLGHAQPLPIAHWPLDDGSGVDIVGGFDGTPTGTTVAPGWDGSAAGALAFDANGDQVLVPPASGLRPREFMTIAAWIRPSTAPAAGGVASRYNSNASRNDWNLWFPDSTGRVRLAVFPTGDSSEFGWQREMSVPVVQGAWQHVVATYSSSPLEIRLFLNGIEQSGQYFGSPVALIASNPEPFRIGAFVGFSGSVRSFLGSIDDVQLWNVALTPGDVRCLYQSYFPSSAIAQQPVSRVTCPGAEVSFSVVATDPGPFSYAWRKDAKAIDPEINPTAAAATLVIAAAQAEDAGLYDVIVANPCGEVLSQAAELLVCAADFNCDGVTNSTDVSDFINQWFQDQVDGTLVTDWDDNGVVNSTDVSDFINDWFAGIAAGCG